MDTMSKGAHSDFHLSQTFSHLLEKYDRPVPRYTSYPPVPSWSGISGSEWQNAVEKCLLRYGTETSVYIHVPYCQALCSFCACTRVISRDRNNLAIPFVNTVLRELDFKIAHLPRMKLLDLHLGGGTPNWLPPEELGRLIEGVKNRFDNELVNISIEIDPRSFIREHAQILSEVGVKRVSLGVQDFNEATLRAIKRFQTIAQLEKVLSELETVGINSFNFDLVYGLPYQNQESIMKTGAELARFRPSRVAVYSYAHLPSIKVAQRGIEKHGLPIGEDKWRLYSSLREVLCEVGYREIGMDHFALLEDELTNAQQSGKLHRNFMGYTIRRTSLLVGLGPSSLSDAWFAFAQNSKDIDKWKDSVETSTILKPEGGHLLSSEDLRRRQIILNLMCEQKSLVSKQDCDRIASSDVLADRLIDINPITREILVSKSGRPFLRNICSLFDERTIYGGNRSFSRAV